MKNYKSFLGHGKKFLTKKEKKKDMVKASLSTVNALFLPSLYPKRMTTSYLIRRGETANQVSTLKDTWYVQG